jgi:hypothetical protein
LSSVVDGPAAIRLASPNQIAAAGGSGCGENYSTTSSREWQVFAGIAPPDARPIMAGTKLVPFLVAIAEMVASVTASAS